MTTITAVRQRACTIRCRDAESHHTWCQCSCDRYWHGINRRYPQFDYRAHSRRQERALSNAYVDGYTDAEKDNADAIYDYDTRPSEQEIDRELAEFFNNGWNAAERHHARVTAQ